MDSPIRVLILLLGLILIYFIATGHMGSVSTSIFMLTFCVGGIAIYCAPSYFAHKRNVKNFGSIVVLNLFFGWTLIGWVIAMAMAMADPKIKN